MIARFARRATTAALIVIGAGGAAAAPLLAAAARPAQPHVILVVVDGVRWQEVFRGADPVIAADKTQVEKIDEIARRFVAPADRAVALTPFLHDIARKGGVILGDRDHGSCMRVANPYWFSYPGYNELLTGRVDVKANTNDPVPNPNVTVLEWLNRNPDYAGKVRVFGSWSVFHAIFNDARSGLPVNAGLEPLGAKTPDAVLIDKLQADTPHPWDTDERFDAFTHAYAMRSMRVDAPRVLYVGYGEPDAHAHTGTYDEYLLAIHRADGFVRELWDAAQADPSWAGNTTLIVTTDHGRGANPSKPDRWSDHGSGVDEQGVEHPADRNPGSEQNWAAVLGPRPLARAGKDCATSSQVAATAVQALGIDWRRFDARAAPPLTATADRKP